MEKPGIKSTEFWLMLLATILDALVAAEVLPQTWMTIAAAVASTLGALGYVAFRSHVKASTAKAEASPEA